MVQYHVLGWRVEFLLRNLWRYNTNDHMRMQSIHTYADMHTRRYAYARMRKSTRVFCVYFGTLISERYCTLSLPCFLDIMYEKKLVFLAASVCGKRNENKPFSLFHLQKQMLLGKLTFLDKNL